MTIKELLDTMNHYGEVVVFRCFFTPYLQMEFLGSGLSETVICKCGDRLVHATDTALNRLVIFVADE